MKQSSFAFLILLFSALILTQSSCTERDERLYVDDKFNADSLKALIIGEYKVSMKGLTFANNQMVQCDTCNHFLKYMKLNTDYTWRDSTLFTPKDSVVENRSGRWEFVNKNVVALHTSDEVEIILEKDSTNLFFRVFRFKGQIIPPGEQPLYVRHQSQQTQTEQTMEATSPGTPFFKAHGNEPFWSIEVFNSDDKHENTWMIYKPMEGEKQEFELPVASILEDGGGNTTYYTLDKKTSLNIKNIKSNDGMSDKEYWYTVHFKSTGLNLKGVGEFYEKSLNTERGYVEEPTKKIAAADIYKKWNLKTIDGKSYKSSRPAFIALGNDGTSLTGNTGCNNLFGKFEMKNNIMRFLNVGSTKMACMEMDENIFMTNFNDSHTFELANNQLTLTNSKGVKMVFSGE